MNVQGMNTLTLYTYAQLCWLASKYGKTLLLQRNWRGRKLHATSSLRKSYSIVFTALVFYKITPRVFPSSAAPGKTQAAKTLKVNIALNSRFWGKPCQWTSSVCENAQLSGGILNRHAEMKPVGARPKAHQHTMRLFFPSVLKSWNGFKCKGCVTPKWIVPFIELH